MEESEQVLPVPADQTAQAAGATVETAEEEAVEEPTGVEVEIEETLTRAKVISRLRAIVIELEGGSLVVGGAPVGELSESVHFELEYCEKNGKHEVEIELKW